MEVDKMDDVIDGAKCMFILLVLLMGIWVISWMIGNGFYTGYNVAKAGYEIKLLKVFQENYKPAQ